MQDREGVDFSDVVTDLHFKDRNIVAVPSKFDNAAGVYYSEQAKEGFQYVAAFATKDVRGMTWLEIFGVEKDGTKMVLRGRAGSKFLGNNPEETEIRREASVMIGKHLRPEAT